MKTKVSEIKLGVFFFFLLTATVLVQLFLSSSNANLDRKEIEAGQLAVEWFKIIEKTKIKKGIPFEQWKNIKYGALLGKDYSNITTTLGSLEAKQTALNPRFASLVYRWLKKSNIDSTKTVGVIISGSFPSLAISTLAAIRVINAKTVLISSIGASTYGANESQATWIDYESWLRSKAGVPFSSSILTIGGENEIGEGMLEEGIEELKLAAERNSMSLYYPTSLQESIEMKTRYLLEKNISLLINIGGNQAALGACRHSSVLPNGIWKNYSICNHHEKGILLRIYEKGIPVIHLINVRDLAAKNMLVIGQVE